MTCPGAQMCPPSVPNNKSHSLFTLPHVDSGQGAEVVDLNLTPCPLKLSLLPEPSSSSRGLPVYVRACCGVRQELGARVSQSTLSKRPNPMCRVVTRNHPPHSSWWETALRLKPKELFYPETGTCSAWSLVVPRGPAGEREHSVISSPQLLLRNSRPATGPRT